MAAARLYLSFLLAVLSLGIVSGRVQDCTYKDPTSGKVYDMSPLISKSGYYKFIQQVWSIGGFSLDSMVSDTQVNVTFYVQVCRNILLPPIAACNETGAIYSVMNGVCTSWGDTNVAVFDINPFHDGVNIKMYHGGTINHLDRYQSIMFFVCNKGSGRGQDEVPFFEHIKAATNQAHFKVLTKLAC